MKIIFGNYFKKIFWSWEIFWQNAKGERVSQCSADSTYAIKVYYFWFFAVELKKNI